MVHDPPSAAQAMWLIIKFDTAMSYGMVNRGPIPGRGKFFSSSQCPDRL
jgi:hypothetical protein